jgi:asparagine synthase (glutamine-hydrolysing)
MNRGPIEARFPFLEPKVCEYALGIDTRWLVLDTANAETMLKLIDAKAGARSSWAKETAEVYNYLVRYLDNGGNHPEGTDEHTINEIEKLFWKLPLVVAGMHAVDESYLPFHCLLFPKLRGQHGSGLTSLEPLVVERYGYLGKTDQEIFRAFIHNSYGC